MRHEFRTLKVRAPLADWLKRKAARDGVRIYVLVEDLIAAGLGRVRPWDFLSARDKSKMTRSR